MPTDTIQEEAQQFPVYDARIVTIADFDAVNFLVPAIQIKGVQGTAMYMAYMRAAEAAHLARDEPGFQVFRLLSNLCSFHFRPDDPAAAFGPLMETGGGRSPIPDDFRGKQCGVLNELLPRVTHPGLRARIADTVWTNDRRQPAAGRHALDGYCEAAEGLLDGTFDPEYSGVLHACMEQVEQLQRAFTIANKLHKRGQLPERLTTLFQRCFDQAEHLVLPGIFARLCEFAIRYGLIPYEELAPRTEALAGAARTQTNVYHLAVKHVWDLAAAMHARAGDNEAQVRCQLEGIEGTLAMQNEVASPLAKASWIRDAISELRQIRGTKTRVAELTAEMRALQDRSPEEMGIVSTPIDLEAQIKLAETAAEGFSLSQALRELALLTIPRPMAALREQALKIAQQAPLTAMMSHQVLDVEGKVVAETPGASLEGDPADEWFQGQIARHESVRRHIRVAGTIEPGRQVIASSYNFSERHFKPIVEQSAFVPQYHEGIFILGFARMIQGDYASAAHLLIPQLENAVRHVLSLSGRDPSKIMGDMRQEDRSLSAILEHMRDDMVEIFTADNTDEIDRLFNLRPGPALRHEFAHGKISFGECYQPDIIYACWFIYHLCCLPLLQEWDERVTPALNAQG